MGSLILLAGLFVAYANGANDNFKGVPTLFGSGTTDYKRALFGLMNGKANWQVIRNILLSWVATLPLAGLLSAAVFLALRPHV